jgi:multidrug resistance protein
MFTPGIQEIADDFDTSVTTVVGASTGFVICLGIGPLILAPLSETFGRRMLYIVCFSAFTLLQIPTALSPNIETLIVVRTISGFFGSIGIANGGGTIGDMFIPSERAAIFGWYLLGPLMGPALGPLFGGLIVENLGWRWVFWALTIVCTTNTLLGIFFLKESYAPVILEARCKSYEQDRSLRKVRYEGQDDRPFRAKVFHAVQRPLKILFTQPIVFTMAVYQAILFGTNYSLYTNFEDIWGANGYGYSTTGVGFMYLGFGAGFLIAILGIVPRIDTVYNKLTERNKGKSKPEYRLPLANIGAILIPASLFWFAWTVEYHVHWFPTILSTVFFSAGQVTVFNTVQNYYIDSFEKYAASAIAAGAVFRSLIGGVVPLFAPGIFDNLGYGWGITCFGFAAVLLSPSPVLFYYFGERLREKFEVDL